MGCFALQGVTEGDLLAGATFPPGALDSVVQHVDAFRREDGSINETMLAQALNVPRATMQHRVRHLVRTGRIKAPPAAPGFEIKSISTQQNADGAVEKTFIKQVPERGPVFAVPEGHVVKGRSALIDGEGRVVQEWVKTQTEPSVEDSVEYLKTAFKDFKRAAPTKIPKTKFNDTLTLFPVSDAHIGLFAWGKETEQNWDVKIAEEKIGGAMRELVAATAPSETAVILGGGDQLHADSNENKTAKSGNVLQVDGRYAKVLGAACKLFVRMIDLALDKHKFVEVRILQGNHDEHAAIAISYFLLAWYRDEKRVFVDNDPSLFWWRRHGKTLLGATHGHMAKPGQMPSIMAHRRAKDWGETVHRFAHTFHVHHASKIVTEGEGVIVETHQAPVPQDAWHFGSGFISGRSLQAIVYDKEHGETGRHRVALTR